MMMQKQQKKGAKGKKKAPANKGRPKSAGKANKKQAVQQPHVTTNIVGQQVQHQIIQEEDDDNAEQQQQQQN